MTAREIWGWIDIRTGKRASVTSTSSREAAEAQLEAWHARDRKGGRPDLHDSMPYLRVARLDAPYIEGYVQQVIRFGVAEPYIEAVLAIGDTSEAYAEIYLKYFSPEDRADLTIGSLFAATIALELGELPTYRLLRREKNQTGVLEEPDLRADRTPSVKLDEDPEAPE